MAVQEEPPARGGQWLNNAQIHERSRASCLEYAEKADAESKPEDAAHWRELADSARWQRDRAHAEGLRRQMNRHLNAQRRWH